MGIGIVLAAVLTVGCGETPTAPTTGMFSDDQLYAKSAAVVTSVRVASYPEQCTTCTATLVRIETLAPGFVGVGFQHVTLTITEGDGRLEQTEATTDYGGVAEVRLWHTAPVVVDVAHTHGGHTRHRVMPITIRY